MRFVDFQALDPKFQLALEPKVLKLEGPSFENMTSIYVLKGWYEETPQDKGLPISPEDDTLQVP